MTEATKPPTRKDRGILDALSVADVDDLGTLASQGHSCDSHQEPCCWSQWVRSFGAAAISQQGTEAVLSHSLNLQGPKR